MEKLIITMPIAPYKTFSVGKMTTPILAETLAKKMNGKFILAVNILDSYKNRSLDEYKKLLEKYNIVPDEYWLDIENIEKLLEKVYYLVSKGYIYSKEKEILSCQCKKVEISKDNLDTINMQDACFDMVNGKYFCKSCKNECTLNKTESLVFNPSYILEKQMMFYPEFINKDIKTFFDTVGKNEIIISRNRETGIKVTYNFKQYNLDIDFLWQLYLSLFPNKEKIVICSNHQLYQLFMVCLLEKCFEDNGKTICLATPYLNINNNESERELEDRIISLKLFALLNQKWSKKENIFDEGLVKFINSMNVVKKQMLYDIVTEQIQETEVYKDLKLILTKKINIQNANQELKRRRKNV